MQVVLLVSDDCGICDEAEKAFKEKYKKEIKEGEAAVVNIEEDEDAQRLWMQNNLDFTPTIIVVTEDFRVITEINPDKHLKESNKASPATQEAVTAPG